MDGLRVLAIDDQREILDVVQLALETTTDWALTRCRSAKAAIDAYDGTAYDIVLLDLTIPGEDAAATITALREHGITDTVILLTGADVTDARRLEIGADHVLEKPFHPMTLAASIESVLTH
jgi:DNA-binding response OmpR family regulator